MLQEPSTRSNTALTLYPAKASLWTLWYSGEDSSPQKAQLISPLTVATPGLLRDP